jgi:predicted DCC family thiol-disulfide oxidoreductase YuxK
MAANEYLLLLDGDCGICGALGRWIKAADLRHRIRLGTIQSSRELLRDIPDDRIFDAFHVVSPSGQLSTGGDAVPFVIEALPMGAGFGRMLRGSRGLMAQVRRLYGFLTRFRDRLLCRVAFGGTSAGSGP